MKTSDRKSYKSFLLILGSPQVIYVKIDRLTVKKRNKNEDS